MKASPGASMIMPSWVGSGLNASGHRSSAPRRATVAVRSAGEDLQPVRAPRRPTVRRSARRVRSVARHRPSSSRARSVIAVSKRRFADRRRRPADRLGARHRIRSERQQPIVHRQVGRGRDRHGSTSSTVSSPDGQVRVRGVAERHVGRADVGRPTVGDEPRRRRRGGVIVAPACRASRTAGRSVTAWSTESGVRSASTQGTGRARPWMALCRAGSVRASCWVRPANV